MAPSWLQWYKKPSYVDIKQFAAGIHEKAPRVTASPRSSLDGRRVSGDIPSNLSLEKILKNETCSPMSLHDFYMYLKYIEYSPENLEFYLWFLDYESAYHATASSASNSSSSLWEVEQFTAIPSSPSQESNHGVLDIEKGGSNGYVGSFFDEPCASAKDNKNRESTSSLSFASIFRSRVVESLTADKDGTLNPAAQLIDTRQKELRNVAATFLLPESPKELNITAAMRNECLEAIATSSSPHHLKPIAEHCLLLLSSCSHRNFIRLGVSNGTFETVCMGTGLGIMLTIAGFICMLLLAFTSPGYHQSSRWRGVAAWPMWTIGIGLILSGIRGSCFFLLLFSRRQPLPWESMSDDAAVIEPPKRPALIRFFSKIMIFDRKVRVKDHNLRKLQFKIVIQSVLGGAIFATAMEIFFLALPIWK
ncbi:hypothetical protein PVAG01_01452 [Phlyctema vagabunda]|uniref:RGS domain-containing protein n=1 Tax=Phlyctema vagabunda TaxID=108571 RepID=A0ABR4PXM2_9HELO